MEPINTALFAYGMSGSVFHAPFIDEHDGFNLYAVLERNKKSAHERYSTVLSFDTAEEMLADKNIELVIVNTPNNTHFDLAKKSILAGKHVVVEKPFTITTSEADELINLAKANNVKLAVYHNRRWDSDFQTIRKVVDDQLLGEIVEAEFHFDRYKEELSAKKHKEIPGPGTGILYDLGSHMIDQAIVLFGYPLAVFGDLRVVREISDVDDYMEVVLYYPKLRVRIKGSYLVREPIPAFSLFGSKGTFLKHRGDIQEERLQAGDKPGSAGWGVEPDALKGLLHSEVSGEIVRKNIDTEAGDYMQYYNLVHQSIRKNTDPPVDGKAGRAVIAIIEAAIQSSEERRVIDL